MFPIGSYTVILKGYNLIELFEALLEHSPKIITTINPRDSTQSQPKDAVVTELVVKSD